MQPSDGRMPSPPASTSICSAYLAATTKSSPPSSPMPSRSTILPRQPRRRSKISDLVTTSTKFWIGQANKIESLRTTMCKICDELVEDIDAHVHASSHLDARPPLSSGRG